VIVADTSAWIEFLRGSEHPARAVLADLLRRQDELAVTELVVMELLAGRPSGRPAQELRSRLLALPMLRLEGLADFEEAASIYRTCRSAGETVRSLIDCLIAVPAIRAGAALLHNDRDFDAIARHTALKIHPAPSR